MIFWPVGYSPRSNAARTVRPLLVVVPRMKASRVSQVRNGTPAQLQLIWLNNLCSIGFHLDKVS